MSLKRKYRNCHTKFHSIIGCEESALATYTEGDKKFW